MMPLRRHCNACRVTPYADVRRRDMICYAVYAHITLRRCRYARCLFDTPLCAIYDARQPGVIAAAFSRRRRYASAATTIDSADMPGISATLRH